MESADLAIVGGGPAGLAVAIRAAHAGLDTLVLDRGGPAHDKCCGEGLMPSAAEQLASLGVRVAAQESRRFAGIRFVQDGASVEARFWKGFGLAMRRPVLHAAMVRRAEEAGARLAWNRRVRALEGAGLGTDAGHVRARFVVGADGLHSRVRRWTGLDAGPGRPRRYGVRRHFEIAPWSDVVEVHWTRGAEAYVTPVSPGLVGVNVTWDGSAATFDDLLARFPTLAARLAGTPVASEDRGAGPLRQDVHGVVRGRVALVGDAAGYLDSITGEGLELAFRQAEALVSALRADDLAAYERVHRRIGRVPGVLTHAMLFLTRHPDVRALALRALAAAPGLFTTALDAGYGAGRAAAAPSLGATSPRS